MLTTPSVATDIILFGAKGDLATRKLMPALFNLYCNNRIHPESKIIGVSRTQLSSKEYRQLLIKNAKFNSAHKLLNKTQWKKFADQIHYIPYDAQKSEGYHQLGNLLTQNKFNHKRLYYLATDSSLYPHICRELHQQQLINDQSSIVLEKPIGHDLQSAQNINRVVEQYFSEDRTFRIDHYLGKETVQNLFALRFANPLFEFQWNYQFIDHIQISIAESIGVEGRAEFYENVGALRDMVQNHLLQLLCIIAMEPPVSLEPDAVRDEKVKVLKALRPIKPESFTRNVIRGQYGESNPDSPRAIAYTSEIGVAKDSRIETFIALKARIDNWRWAGVPFYLRTGKRLPERCCEIVVQFKAIPHSIFESFSAPTHPNKLVIRLQPEESIGLEICLKDPGSGMNIITQDLNLSPTQKPDRAIQDAYERLLEDAINGNTMLFMRKDELEAAWQWIDPIEQYGSDKEHNPELYPAGTWGPSSSTLMLAKDGRLWHEIS